MTTKDRHYDIQGRFCGMPYDWRLPTVRKIASRVWDPGGPLLPPRTWGVGWTINCAHPGAGWLFAAVFLVGMVLAATLG